MRLRKCILVIVFLSLHFWPKSWCQVYLSWVGNQELWWPQVRLQPDIQCLGRTRSRYAQPAFLLFPCIVYVNMSCSLIYSCTVRYKLMLRVRNQILYKSGPVVLGLKMHGNNLRPNPPLRSLLCPERQEFADLQPRGVALKATGNRADLSLLPSLWTRCLSKNWQTLGWLPKGRDLLGIPQTNPNISTKCSWGCYWGFLLAKIEGVRLVGSTM